MDGRDQRRFIGRLRALFVVFVALALAIIARSAQLQVLEHDELAKMARGQYLDDVQIPARRGHIYDRRNEPLAISVDVPSVYANPGAVDDPRGAARALAPLLGEKREAIYERLVGERLFVWLKRQVSPDIEAQVRTLGLAGIGITKESRRFYPHRELGAAVVGFAGVDGRGLEGIERAFDEVLAGEPQVVPIERDGRGRTVLMGGLDPEQRTSGADVILTLDLQIEHAAEAALARAVKATHARAGIVVVLDAPSADVLATAVWPSFNPNLAAEAPADARRNRALTDMFEPGSSFKPFIIGAALETHTVRPDLTLYCENGSFTVGDRTIRDAEPHGWLTLTGIIQKSSNICAAKVGAMLGAKRLAQWLSAYGFGQRSGISFPGETTGIVRDPSTWGEVGVATISYGHGVAVSALQLAAAYRVLASSGRYRTPRLVMAVRSPEGERLDVPLAAERQVLSRATTERLRGMLEAVVGPGGTGELAAVPGYRVAGKTGTAEKPDLVAGGYDPGAFMAVFAGFLPSTAPRAVIVVVLDEPTTRHTGGAVAAPVFSEVAAATMRVLGVPPSHAAPSPPDPKTETVALAMEDPPREGPPAPPGTLSSFIGLTARQAVRRFTEVGTGLELELSGSGRVVRQDPPPGSKRARAQRVSLVMAE